MERELELHCRDDLRQARAALLADAEAFPQVLFAIERTGAALTGRSQTLQAYRRQILELAQRSELGREGRGASVARLYDQVQQGRNEALHQGAFARHLADRAAELALILEDALVNGSDRISDYMVKAPLVAHAWQPLRVVRHQMLSQSFSFLPLRLDKAGWRLISDLGVARVLRQARDKADRERRLGASVTCAITEYHLLVDKPTIVGPADSVARILQGPSNLPILIVDEAHELLGIATPFDLL
jgi:hypothetical protein